MGFKIRKSNKKFNSIFQKSKKIYIKTIIFKVYKVKLRSYNQFYYLKLLIYFIIKKIFKINIKRGIT